MGRLRNLTWPLKVLGLLNRQVDEAVNCLWWCPSCVQCSLAFLSLYQYDDFLCLVFMIYEL